MAHGEYDLSGAVVLPVDRLARSLGWTTLKAKRWMRRNGIGRKEPGKYGRWYTTTALLRSLVAEDADYIIAGILTD